MTFMSLAERQLCDKHRRHILVETSWEGLWSEVGTVCWVQDVGISPLPVYPITGA